MTLVDTDFINNAVEINAKHDTRNDEKTYSITSEWMKLRTDDENFVIETILEACKIAKDDSLFSSIDTTKIGLMGHSLGGATSAQMGRLRDDIDAVIILDGTMLGEEIDFVDHAVVLNDEPYPVPLLNIYAQDHYENAKTFVGDSYNNFYASENAIEAYETVFSGAGHLNFTDLPIFSPALAKMLGVGEVDERICLETMNTVILEFFNAYLKNESNPIIAKEY
jgi:dienelactone hydrolase